MDLQVTVTLPRSALFDGRAPLIVGREIVSATEWAVNALVGAIAPLTPVGVAGTLRSAVQSDVTDGSGEVRGRVFNPLGYALPVEEGARPHFPPIGPLELWARRKLGVPDGEARSVAFRIARAISRRGTPAVRMFARGSAQVTPAINNRFAEATARIVAGLQ